MAESKKRMGERLLDLEDAAASAKSPQQVAAVVLKRDRSRIRRLAAMSILLWLIAVTGIGVIAYGYFEIYMPRVTGILTQPVAPEDRNLEYEEYLRGTEEGLLFLQRTGWIVALGSLAAVAVAAIATVALITAARRVTLRQVEASLAEISEQLQSLRQSTATPPNSEK